MPRPDEETGGYPVFRGSMRTRMRADSRVTSAPDSSSRLSRPIVVDHTTQDFSEVLSGYDLVIDSLGGQNLEKSLSC